MGFGCVLNLYVCGIDNMWFVLGVNVWFGVGNYCLNFTANTKYLCQITEMPTYRHFLSKYKIIIYIAFI